MIIRPPVERNETSFRERAKTHYQHKTERKESLRLAWSLMNRQDNPKKPTDLSKTVLSIVTRAYQSH